MSTSIVNYLYRKEISSFSIGKPKKNLYVKGPVALSNNKKNIIHELVIKEKEHRNFCQGGRKFDFSCLAGHDCRRYHETRYTYMYLQAARTVQSGRRLRCTASGVLRRCNGSHCMLRAKETSGSLRGACE